MKAVVLTFLLFLSIGFSLIAQEPESKFSANASFKLVSKYMFRGVEMTKDPNIVGEASIGYKGWTLGMWATTNYSGTFYEPDIYISYAPKNFVFTLYDFDMGQGNDYFNFNNKNTTHLDEFSVKYTVSEKIPLSFTVGTTIWGADKKVDHYDSTGQAVLKDKNNFSTYVEAVYPFVLKEITVTPTIGLVTSESYTYGSKGFSLINVGVTFEKRIRVSDKLSIPVGYSFIYNQSQKRAYSVMSIGI
ncbi:MAG: hypothetical protein WCP85_20710 [Mariniphaga sp.]